ncbi:MAG: VOC family protein [Bacteroidota bacterium]
MRIAHIALWAADLDGLRLFYQTYFGARCDGDKYVNPAKGFASTFLSFADGARLELMSRSDVGPRPPGGECVGLAHLAFATGSIAAVDALTRRLEADGYRRLDGPRRTGDGYYESVVLDPEGNRIEITI